MKLGEHPMKTNERERVCSLLDWAKLIEKATRSFQRDLRGLSEKYEDSTDLCISLNRALADLDLLEEGLKDLQKSCTEILA